MITATSLGDVMHEARYVEEFGFFDAFEYFIRKGVVILVLIKGKSPEIANDEKRVFVDGVDMKKVILHPSHHPSKGR